MRRLLCGLLLLFSAARLAAGADIAALAYHDIVPVKDGDPFSITVAEFRRHMEYLAQAGYQPISLAALQRAREGKAELPPKPVLLTFDDGYKSYHDTVFPILREYGFPSVISLVTSWIDRRSVPDYATAEFMTWTELRTLARSPLVEILSHSDDLHRRVVANAFGARMPAAETRLYDATANAYESEAAHRVRLRSDLERSVERIRDELGVAPLGITWPYGRYDGPALEIAAELGMRVYLTLDDEPTSLVAWPRINRATFRDYRKLADLGNLLTFRDFRKRQWRFVSVDLATFADKTSAEQARLIFELGQRVELLRVNAVVLRPFTPDGKRAYFHTDAMPVAADVLSQIAFQLTERAGLRNLILQVPAGLDARVYADLARLNWFSGVVIEGADADDEFTRVAEVLQRLKPALNVGVPGEDATVDARASFTLIDVAMDTPPATIAQRVEAAMQASPRPLFMLERTPTTSAEALTATMATLRAAGALHYGYGVDDFTQNRPEFLRIVRPLAEYAIPPARP